MKRTITWVTIAAIAVGVIWLLALPRNQSGVEDGNPPANGQVSGSAGLPPQENSGLPSKADRTPKVSRLPKITENDIDEWLDLPLEGWLAKFDERAPNAPKHLRSEIAALLGELKEVRRRGIPPEHAMYRARRDAIVKRFYERYTGQNALTPEQIAERRKTIGIVGVQVAFAALEAGTTPRLQVIPGLPADKSGIKAGDELLAVNGLDIRTLDPGEVTLRLRGAPGEKVTLRIRSNLTGEEVVHEIERVDSDEVQPGTNTVQ